MKRLRRIIFNALTVLSLLLCVATVTLWIIIGNAKHSLLGRIENPHTTVTGFYLRLTAAIVPYWFVTALTAFIPMLWLATYVIGYGERFALRRHAQHQCPRCSYDLRATPGRCPKCGTILEKATA